MENKTNNVVIKLEDAPQLLVKAWDALDACRAEFQSLIDSDLIPKSELKDILKKIKEAGRKP